MAGFRVVEVPSDARGNVDLDALRALVAQHGPQLVGLMLTNPNTLGLFDENVEEVVRLVHEAGGLVYGDGANFNAILGIARPGDLGFDVMHYNLHKTFSTPHGGGGPGSGAVGVAAHLADYLPGPVVAYAHDHHHPHSEGKDPTLPGSSGEETDADEDEHAHIGEFYWTMPAKSIGRVKAFYGNFGVLVRAYTYIRMHGAAGLRAGERERRAQRQLPAGAAARRLPDPARRPHLHARVRRAGHPGRARRASARWTSPSG